MAQALRFQNRLTEAVTILRQAIQACEPVWGFDNQNVMTAREILVSTFGRLELYAEAEAECALLVKADELRRGSESAHVVLNRFYYAQAVFLQEKYEEALELIRRAASDTQRVLGSDHVATKAAQQMLKVIERKLGLPSAK